MSTDSSGNVWGIIFLVVLAASTGLGIYLWVSGAAWYWIIVAFAPDMCIAAFMTWLLYDLFGGSGNILD